MQALWGAINYSKFARLDDHTDGAIAFVMGP